MQLFRVDTSAMRCRRQVYPAVGSESICVGRRCSKLQRTMLWLATLVETAGCEQSVAYLDAKSRVNRSHGLAGGIRDCRPPVVKFGSQFHAFPCCHTVSLHTTPFQCFLRYLIVSCGAAKHCDTADLLLECRILGQLQSPMECSRRYAPVIPHSCRNLVLVRMLISLWHRN
jgi:hypothetical protein